MNGRNTRTPASSPASRTQGALVHRGPGAMQATHSVTTPFHHAPNAALLIDFDNVTMGIRSDLGKELRNLLSSDIIKGKVAVQRAYADWRRYPQYIVPLSEASIDLIFAPAYGSSKKNATDIRLAIDALELVFTRAEIGTFILLSGDSDFSSLVIKLKEYGKYVIGVGIRESSSDLLVQNCDEYYSYNALAGLVKASEEEATKFDPWELVTEAVTRMKRNGDVMRSDRLKQVMQEVDPTFDEKDLGMSKFSRFVQEAAQRGLLSMTKLENGQLEIGLPTPAPTWSEPRAHAASPEPAEAAKEAPSREREEGEAEERGRGGRRGRRGRGRGRAGQPGVATEGAGFDRGEPAETTPAAQPDLPARLELAAEPLAPAPAAGGEAVGVSGERLTRNEAFDYVRRAVETLTTDDEDATRASAVRQRVRELLARDSESLNERMFVRILKDAHDAGVIDLRRRGDDFEVARAAMATTVAEQVARADQATAQATATPAAHGAAAARLGMGPRGARGRGRPDAPPPELLSVGIVEDVRQKPAEPEPIAPEPLPPPVVVVPDLQPPVVDVFTETPADEEARKPKPRARKSRRESGGMRAVPEPGAEQPPVVAIETPSGEEEPAGAGPAASANKRARGKRAVKGRPRRPLAKKAGSKSNKNSEG